MLKSVYGFYGKKYINIGRYSNPRDLLSRLDKVYNMKTSELLKSRQFFPFFMTQFFGAMNDNLFKTVILISFTLIAAEQAGAWSNFANMAFVLPFFLFSAKSGYYADQVEKSAWIQKIKLLEIIIMSFGVVCLWFDALWGMVALLFLMGTQSTLFGPVKYSIIPQHVQREDLNTANAWVELGTFLAILVGNIIAGLVFEIETPKLVISILLITFAIIGWFSSRSIPDAPSLAMPDKPVQKHSTWSLIKHAKQNRSVFLSMLGVSWFWFLGAAYLTQLPVYTSQYLSSTESVITMFLVAFSVGIGIGSLLCSLLSAGKVEIGLVPLGALGLSIFGGFLAAIPPITGTELSLGDALASSTHWQVFFMLIGVGISGGLYIVPLYGLIQTRSEESERAQMIAANNILNALFMVMASIFGLVVLAVLKLGLDTFFWCLVVLNLCVAAYIFTLVPEFVARFLVWCLVNIMYRVKHNDLNKVIPEQGPAIIVANHVSFVDALIIGGLVPRPTRFIMFKPIYDMPVLNFIFRALRTIPIDSKTKNPEVYDKAFDSIAKALDNGELIVLFPEGKLTRDGEVDEFKPGLLKILERNTVPVIPMGLQGLWGSFFSHQGGNAMAKLPKRFLSRVALVSGEPVSHHIKSAEPLDLHKLREEVVRLTRQSEK